MKIRTTASFRDIPMYRHDRVATSIYSLSMILITGGIILISSLIRIYWLKPVLSIQPPRSTLAAKGTLI